MSGTHTRFFRLGTRGRTRLSWSVPFGSAFHAPHDECNRRVQRVSTFRLMRNQFSPTHVRLPETASKVQTLSKRKLAGSQDSPRKQVCVRTQHLRTLEKTTTAMLVAHTDTSCCWQARDVAALGICEQLHHTEGRKPSDTTRSRALFVPAPELSRVVTQQRSCMYEGFLVQDYR